MASDQVVDEGQHYEEARGGGGERQPSQPFGERRHQVEWKMTGKKNTRQTILKKRQIDSFWGGCKSYLELRNKLARWKNRALYFTWKTVGSRRLYSFL